MIVYKVLVKDTKGNLVSAGAPSNNELVYTPGEHKWHPNMFVFGTFEDAKRFKGLAGWVQIWECETRQTRPGPSRILSFVGQSVAFASYWLYLEDWPIDVQEYLVPTPNGTLLVDDLKLIRKVG